MGSKNRIAKHILPIMLAEAEKHGVTTWVEPFVGGANMIDKVPSSYKRIGIDLNAHVIQALIDIRDKPEQLPEKFTFEERNFWKQQEATELMSWACIVTSFGADLLGGYARESGSDDTTFCGYGKRNALKQSPKLQDVLLFNAQYDYFEFENSLIYCDPPYQKTSGYKTGAFNHEEFFQWCRDMKAKGNIVFVSEYNAPDDFEVVWQGEIKTNFSSQRKEATHKAVEKLFKV
jgi:DNA adenine methylase